MADATRNADPTRTGYLRHVFDAVKQRIACPIASKQIRHVLPPAS